MEINFYILLGCVFVALTTEIVVNAIKSFIPETEYPITKSIAVIAGVAIAVLSGMDVFEAFGYPLSVPYTGEVFTGIICSIGASAIYELYEGMKDYRDRLAQEKVTNEEV